MKAIDITIYRISGQQLFFNVPNEWCEECDLTINLTKKVLAELGVGKGDTRVRLIVKPWVNFAVQALSKGGWHAPVLMINGEIFSQGVVPNRAQLTEKLRQLLAVDSKTA